MSIHVALPHPKKGRALTERIERLAKETGEAAELHQQEETASRKKKAKVEVELTATVRKYDRDMTAKTSQIEEIKVRARHMNFNGSPVEPHTPYYARQYVLEQELLCVYS